MRHGFSRVSGRCVLISKCFKLFSIFTWLNCLLVMTKKKESRALRSKFHKWHIKDCDVKNGSFNLSYKAAKCFCFFLGRLHCALITLEILHAFIQGCLQQLKWYLNKGSLFFGGFYFSYRKVSEPDALSRLSRHTKILITNWKLLLLFTIHISRFHLGKS